MDKQNTFIDEISKWDECKQQRDYGEGWDIRYIMELWNNGNHSDCRICEKKFKKNL